MSVRVPSGPVKVRQTAWRAGTPIVRIYRAAHGALGLHPGAGAHPARFSPIRDATGNPVPVLYGGSHEDCAIFETFFHDITQDAPQADRVIDIDDYRDRALAVIRPRRDLALADLTSLGLHKLRISEADLIRSPPREYVHAARWAEAIYRQYPALDGLIWISRPLSTRRAIMLFGPRLAPGDLEVSEDGPPLAANRVLYLKVTRLALEAEIDFMSPLSF